MKSTAGTVSQTIKTIVWASTPQSKEPRSPESSPDELVKIRKWQAKWLQMNCHHPKLLTACDIVAKYCHRWFERDADKCLLVMAGNPGCGKTRIAKGIARFTGAAQQLAYERGGWGTQQSLPSTAWVQWPEAVDGFKTGNYEIMHDLFSDDLIVLDDIGAENDPSKNGCAKLCQILSARERRFTVVTTNIQPQDWAHVFNARIADRMLRNSTVIDMFEIPSYATVV